MSPFLASLDRVKGTNWNSRDCIGFDGDRFSLPPLIARFPPLQKWLALLRKRHHDAVEIPGDCRVGENRLSLFLDFTASIPTREVGQNEQLRRSPLSKIGSLPCGAVRLLRGTLCLLVQERCLMDKDVGGVGRELKRFTRSRVSGNDQLPSRARGAENLIGLDAIDRSASLKLSEFRTWTQAERCSTFEIYSAGTLGLICDIAKRGAAMACLERGHSEPFELDGIVFPQFDGVDLKPGPPHRSFNQVENPLNSPRSVDLERRRTLTQVERLQDSREPQPVIGMKVRNEDRVKVNKPFGPRKLTLGSLTAVEEDAVAAMPEQQRRKTASGCWN